MTHSLAIHRATHFVFALFLTFALTALAAEPAAVVDLSHARLATPAPCTGQNDAAVDALYSYGELPIGQVPRDTVRALVSNRGVQAQDNLPVALAVNGASTFMSTHASPPLAGCGGQASLTFPLFNMCRGNAAIQVSIPADDNSANNTVSRPIAITHSDYSYKYPGTTSTGGFGFSGSTGMVAAKFTVTPGAYIEKVKLEFAAATSTSYRIVIYGDAGDGTPSATPLYADSVDRTVTAAGPVTLNLFDPFYVMVPGTNFFVGIQQTNAVNAQLAFDNETPVRTGSFFYRDGASAEWTDFAPGINLKPNIGCVLGPQFSVTATPIYSSKVHGTLGTFSFGSYGTLVEPRSGTGPEMGDHSITFYLSPYNDIVSVGAVTVTSPTGGSAGPATATFDDRNAVTVQLTGMQNAHRYWVTVNKVTYACGNYAFNFPFSVAFLRGDVNGDGRVNSGDITRSRNRSGAAINDRSSYDTLLFDVNVDGSVNAGDTMAVRNSASTFLP